MTAIDLNLQLKFLGELDDALSDALKRYVDDSPEKLDELNYMRSEVKRAQRIVTERITSEEIGEAMGEVSAESCDSVHDIDQTSAKRAAFS